VGLGASVINGITVAEDSIVGAGAVVIRDVAVGVVVVGTPARFLCTSNPHYPQSPVDNFDRWNNKYKKAAGD
jgi:serine acetyltransferase